MILVTGATGHVGNVLVRTLLDRGEDVRALIFPGEDTTSLNGLAVERIEGDILVPGSVRDALVGVEVVYHLAGVIAIAPGKDELMRSVNVEGTRTVALAAREAGVRRFVYTSSIHALARAEEGVLIDESLPFDPENPAGEYDRSKAQASLIVQGLAAEGLDAVIVCPTGILGPHDYRRSELGRAVADWMRPRPHFMVQGRFDWVDVRDVVDGMIRACEYGRTGEVYILSGHQVEVADIRWLTQHEAGRPVPALSVPMWLAKAAAVAARPLHRAGLVEPRFTTYSLDTVESNSAISHTKAAAEIGYRSRPIKDTIADTVAWWRSNAALNRHPRWYGKVALVTGASSGIGAATARRLARMGMAVILVARRQDRLNAVVRQIKSSGGRAESLAVDLSNQGAPEEVLRFVLDRYHGVDVLVNNAGISWFGLCSNMSPDAAASVIKVNNEAVVRLALLILPRMILRRRGHIINIGSVAGSIASQGIALYAATKSFLNTFTTALSRELRGSAVRVSIVKPGAVRTAFLSKARTWSGAARIPTEGNGVSPASVAERILQLLLRPRRVAYVPWYLNVVPFLSAAFGWVLNLVGPSPIRRRVGS